eukprot:3869516-Rhodomonas_salina.5
MPLPLAVCLPQGAHRPACHCCLEGALCVRRCPATILPSKLPWPVLTGDDRHADIKWDWLTLRGVAVVGDKSALHPFMGKGKSTQWGMHQPWKLQDGINGKNWIYAAFHSEKNLQFVLLVGTTRTPRWDA